MIPVEFSVMDEAVVVVVVGLDGLVSVVDQIHQSRNTSAASFTSVLLWKPIEYDFRMEYKVKKF